MLNTTKNRLKKDRAGLLIILPGGLGDLVQARDVLEDVVRRSADDVDLLTGDTLAGLARSWGVFRSVLSLPTDLLYHGSVAGRARLLMRLVWQIRHRRYTSCLLFKAHPGYAVITWAAGIKTRIGLRRGSAPLLTRSVLMRAGVHRLDLFREVAALATGGELDTPKPRRRAARPREHNLKIGIAPGGARNAKVDLPCKRWPIASYRAAAIALADRFPNATFFLLGAKTDKTECDQVMSILPRDRSVSLCGTQRLEELENAIAELDLVITHDTGLLHIAGRTGCGLVGVFGPTNPATGAPSGDGVITLWNPAGPQPCHDDVSGLTNCAFLPCCIERISVQAVVRAAEELLQQPDMRVGA